MKNESDEETAETTSIITESETTETEITTGVTTNIDITTTGTEETTVTDVTSTEAPAETTVVTSEFKTAVFTGLEPGRIYNFYSVKSKEAKNLLSSQNLLYISQAEADENGSLSIEYIPDKTVVEPVEFITGMIYNIENADVKTVDMDYTGDELTKEISVSYNGTPLKKGVDYEIDGSLNVTKPGIYLVTVKGIGYYYSENIVGFRVICEHKYSNGVCTVCGMSENGENINGKIVPVDVNSDSKINISDVVVLNLFLLNVNKYPLTAVQHANADCHKDGVINSSDSTILMNYVAEIIEISELVK